MHISILIAMTVPMMMVFVSDWIGKFVGFVWGFIAWCIVLGQWDEKEGIYSIKNDTLLQQHNKEAEEIERLAPEPPQPPPPPQPVQDPQQVVREIMDKAEEPEPVVKNPFDG